MPDYGPEQGQWIDEVTLPEAAPPPKKRLVLHVEVPDMWADDLDDSAAMYAGADDDPSIEVTNEHRLDVVLEEWMRAEVGLTIVTIPGEKCLNSDFEVHAYTCRIVGAEARDI